MYATSPDQKPRRTDRKTCPHCEGSADGCRSLEWLRARRCCETCVGDHDRPGHPR
jgi:hypothetical protein